MLAYASLAAFIASVGSTLASMGAAYHVAVGMGAGILAAGSLTTAFMAGRAVSSSLAGVLSDAWRRLTPLLPGFFLPLSGAVLLSYRAAVEALGVSGAILAYALWGFFNGLSWPPLQVLVASIPWRGRPSTSLSMYFAIGSLGFAAGFRAYPLLPGYVEAVEAGGVLYLASGAVALAGGLLARNLMPPRRAAGEGGLASRARLPRLALVVLLAAFVVGAAQGLSREYLYVYLGEYKGLEKDEVSAVLSHANLAAAFSIVAVGALADRMGVSLALALDMAIGAAGLTLVAAPGAPALPGVVLTYFSVRSSMPLVRNAAVARGTGYEARVVGVANTLGNLGAMTAPPLAGLVAGALGGAGSFPGASIPLLAEAAAMAAVGVAALKATPRRLRQPLRHP